MGTKGIEGKRKWRQRIRKALLPVLLIAVLLVPVAISTEGSFADILVWHSVNMKPGETYDVSKAKWNTTVFIKKAGDYTLKGSSESVRVLIQSGDVNLYLADGLNINCSAHSYTGSRTAAIWVQDMGGTVKVISKKKATSSLEGYMCPGLRKDGTKTKLVFETEDPGSPGTIKIYSGSQSSNSRDPAALGSMDSDTGNIVFNSGIVYARVRGLNSCGSAIGGAEDHSASNITVNGGYVEAYGSETGAAIGGGAGGVFTGFYVNGGEVYAENQVNSLHIFEGAAIGGGVNDINEGDQTPGNIGAKDFYIKGGEVTAVSHGPGAAIGGGTNSGCSNINIEGGTVNATCDSKKSKYNCQGAGIGGGYGYQISTEVNISGGKVTAKGGYSAPGIGSQDAGQDYNGKDKKADTGTYRISGGTIYSQCGDDARGDIGTRNSKMIVTGGNLHALSHAGDAVNKTGDAVHRVEISFDGIDDDGHAISDLTFQPDDYSYGMNDVETMSGKLHAWLPGGDHYSNYAVTGALVKNDTSDKYRYGGNIAFSANQGTLSPGTLIALNMYGDYVLTSGSAWGVQGKKSLQDMIPPTFNKKGYKLDGYTVNGKKVAMADGTLIPNVSGFTNEKGEWIYNNTNDLTLEGHLAAIKYKVKFEANVPKNASTQCSGTMADQEFQYNTAETLNRNQYVLPGYTFDSWNTKPDGTGYKFVDRRAINTSNQDNLAPEQDGAAVCLYAQWKPMEYTLTLQTFKLNDTNPDKQKYSYRQTGLYFDQPAKITPLEVVGNADPERPWTFEGYEFNGWRGDSSGSFWQDGEEFCNLCVFTGQGGITGEILMADWVYDETIEVTVTKDGMPLSGLVCEGQDAELFLQTKDGSTRLTPFAEEDKDPDTKLSARGTYLYDPNKAGQVPDGTYDLCLNPGAAHSEYLSDQVEITYGGAAGISTIFDYYTASIDKDTSNDGIAGAIISESEGILTANNKSVAPDGAKLTIETTMNDGYHFDGYSLAGVAPGGEFDPLKPVQTITVEGKVDITAHAAPNVYKVHFDANATSGVSGQMEDQDMVYDEPQNLFANGFSRVGGTFKGWNTEKDGSGTWYQDGQSVKKLMTRDGGTFTLYAQWDMATFNIDYDLNGGQLPEGKTNQDSYREDSPTFTLNNPEKEDYSFIGWMGTGLGEPTKTVTIEEGSTGDRDYTAAWEMKYYQVNFEDNGGSAVEPELVKIHGKAVKPADPTRVGHDFVGWYEDAGLTKAYDFNREVVDDITLCAKWKPTKVPVVMAKGVPSGKRAIKVSWTKVDGAAKYMVYAGHCGKKLKCVKTTKKNSYTVKRIKAKRLKAHNPYVLCIAAVDKNGKVIVTSRKFHVLTAKTRGRYANITKIKANKESIAMKVGQKTKVRATCTLPKGKKHLGKAHGPYLRYTTDNPRIAKVDRKGNVKALAPGRATIYIQDTNGMSCKTVITVK